MLQRIFGRTKMSQSIKKRIKNINTMNKKIKNRMVSLYKQIFVEFAKLKNKKKNQQTSLANDVLQKPKRYEGMI